ncbi:MAG: hypothetical protein H0T15_03615 [Thermoleophilaceae bacterium]|nr:hypothetical protein [Thermoleophilaceae bacterium]
MGLRLNSERAPFAAGAAVLLTIAVGVTTSRFDDVWAAFPLFAVTALAAMAVIALLLAAGPQEGEGPDAWQSILIVTSLILVLGSLTELADVLGSSTDNSRTLTWIGLLFTAGATLVALRYRSGVAALFAALAAGFSALAFVDWVASPENEKTFRWVLAGLSIVFLAGAVLQRTQNARQGAQLAIASGVAATLVAVTLIVPLIGGLFNVFGDEEEAELGVAFGWELYLLVIGLALVVYATLDRESGPGYAGGIVLSVFAGFAALPGEDGASLIGWPIVLLLVALAAMGYAYSLALARE